MSPPILIQEGRRTAAADTELLGIIEALKTVMGAGERIIVELIRAAGNMPLLAAIVGLWINGIITKLGLTDKATTSAVFAIIATSTGIELTTELITAITNALDVLPFTSKAAIPNILQPGATVIVYGNGESRDMQGLLAQLEGLKRR